MSYGDGWKDSSNIDGSNTQSHKPPRGILGVRGGRGAERERHADDMLIIQLG